MPTYRRQLRGSRQRKLHVAGLHAGNRKTQHRHSACAQSARKPLPRLMKTWVCAERDLPPSAPPASRKPGRHISWKWPAPRRAPPAASRYRLLRPGVECRRVKRGIRKIRPFPAWRPALFCPPTLPAFSFGGRHAQAGPAMALMPDGHRPAPHRYLRAARAPPLPYLQPHVAASLHA